MNKLYCDLDGVLADFGRGYFEAFGINPDTHSFDDVDWDAVRDYPNFYANLPPMPDAAILWRFLRPYMPVILTGLPRNVPEADANKRAWVRKNLGPDVELVACLSREKCNYCSPGDVLIDDREKYRHLWVAKGGIWITHINAGQSIAALKSLGFQDRN